MMTAMRTMLLKFVLPCVLALSAMPTLAQAPEEEVLHDARLSGYQTANGGVGSLVINPPSGTAGTWFLTVGLGVLCFGVMCKNGKRTHLD